MKIKYTGPIDEVELPGGLTAKRNHVVDVPDEMAGTAPDPRIAVAMVELHDAVVGVDHEGAVKLRKEISGLDFGTGLLAQDTWEAVTPAKKSTDPDKP